MGVLASMVGSAFGTTKNIIFVILLLASLVVNVASFSVNTISMAISGVIEALTGGETVVSMVRRDEVVLARATQSASKLEKDLAGKAAELETERAAKLTAETDLSTARKLTDKWEGTAAGYELRMARAETALVAAEAETASLRAARRVSYEGVEMTVPEAVTKAANKIKTRTAKLALTDLTATGAQALPWIGAAAVVAVTGYDIKMSCDTMKDMRAIEVSVNPDAANDPDVDRVCGLKVPTEAEVWAAIKASPAAVWDAAAKALDGLPSMPDVGSWQWPSLPEIGMPDIPTIDWPSMPSVSWGLPDWLSMPKLD